MPVRDYILRLHQGVNKLQPVPAPCISRCLDTLSAIGGVPDNVRPLVVNVADLCRYRMPCEDGLRQRPVTHNFCRARRRSVMTQPLPDCVGLQHERTAIVYIDHPLIAGCGDDDETLLPVLPVKRRLPDGRKKKAALCFGDK